MTDQAETLCPQDELLGLTQALSTGGGVAEIDAVVARYPGDPRLHFLRGSVLAGERRYGEGRAAIRHAVELAPGFTIARFQLGFLEFTSGEAELAAQTWAPLAELPAGDALRLFSEGLMRLPADDVEGAVARLREGMQVNTDNPPLNRDMQMLIDELTRPPADPAEAEPVSETQMLLRQFGTRH
jgi:hypothetical protein